MQAYLQAKSWQKLLLDVPMIEGLSRIETQLKQAIASGTIIYPRLDLCFEALNRVEFDRVRVVILGQDPYHGAQQAHGLAFSVPRGIVLPPSLRNVMAEVYDDLELTGFPPAHGDLTSWADQGVLLLNSVLTVEAGLPHSHRNLGWDSLTDAVIARLGQRTSPLVFMLWGKAAQKKAALIRGAQHLCLLASHPSPLSVYRGFSGCRHFSRCNQFLEASGLEPVRWALETPNVAMADSQPKLI